MGSNIFDSSCYQNFLSILDLFYHKIKIKNGVVFIDIVCVHDVTNVYQSTHIRDWSAYLARQTLMYATVVIDQ